MSEPRIPSELLNGALKLPLDEIRRIKVVLRYVLPYPDEVGSGLCGIDIIRHSAIRESSGCVLESPSEPVRQ